MSYKLYGMDTYFYNSLGGYSFETRCEMLKELGYDATYLTMWNDEAWEDVLKLDQVHKKYGLDVAAVYCTVDISESITGATNSKIINLVENLKGCDTVEIMMLCGNGSLSPSDEAGDNKAISLLSALLKAADKNGIRLLLYPHIDSWLERIEDAIRLCRVISHPRLGLIFTSYHWYAVDGTSLSEKLEMASPYLQAVNLCGSKKTNPRQATIETLDSGSLDNLIILSELERLGFNGWVGFQGYGIGGDVYGNLKRSITYYKEMERHLKNHPSWTKLYPKLSWM